MAEEDLVKTKFQIFQECCEKLKNAGINFWIIGEVLESDPDGLSAQYSAQSWTSLSGSGERALDGGESDIMEHHLGALAGTTLSIFTDQIEKNFGREVVTPEAALQLMLHCNGVYRKNIGE